ncbi:hypothetical protein I302_101807 [Kwoniella bestiolae CBS 10118]|uniref:F-box domain-containing protein n=1 Tax=Kwoniella bestiolae CBS 10118 TaxID=1296100 RepID=A0A1B9GDA6_9TREE|nr:hypothetical protein I302_00487 [Kwoniella bestiolae CBS 10118]OCF28996.1 hypothetical protein I302_00487 [Kwoniella bestiolae CBS 10118]
MFETTQLPIFPSEILLLILQQLQAFGSMRSLSTFRQVSKSSYSLATPLLTSSYEISASLLVTLQHHQLTNGPDHDKRDLFEVSRSGYIDRKLHDLSFARRLTISRYPIQDPLDPHLIPKFLTTEEVEGSELNLSPIKHDKQAFLPRLAELTLTSFILQDIISQLSTCGGASESHHTTMILPLLTDLGLSQRRIRKITFEYPSAILDQADMDLSSDLARSIRYITTLFPSVEQLSMVNVHLQPILLPPPRNGLKKVIVTFSRHSKCPDMGGIVYCQRKQQVLDALLGLENEFEHVCDGVMGMGETTYEFRNTIGSIPQWEGGSDIEVQRKGMIDELYPRTAAHHNQVTSMFNLVEGEVSDQM